jgi:hypothetical protein
VASRGHRVGGRRRWWLWRAHGAARHRDALARIAAQALQVGAQVGGRLIAQRAVFLERLGDDPIEFRRDQRIEGRGRRGVAVEDAVEDDGGGVAWKTHASGGHLVEHHAEREEVGAHIELFGARLFRRHVGDGAHGGAHDAREDGGLERGRVVGAGPPQRTFGELRQTEVEHLGLPALGQEDVGGLDVAVQDVFAVRRVERIGDLRRHVEQRLGIERSLDETPVERLALEQFHGQVAAAVLVVEPVDGADVGVIEARRGAGLTPEPVDRFGIFRRRRRQHLQGHHAAEHRVLRAVHDAHATGAQGLENGVMTEFLP